MKSLYDQRSELTSKRAITDFPSGVALLEYITSLISSGVTAASIARQTKHVTEKMISNYVSVHAADIRYMSRREKDDLKELYGAYMDDRIYVLYIRLLLERAIRAEFAESGLALVDFCRHHSLPVRNMRRILQDSQ